MSDLKWYINRMKAMDTKEILWRLQQKKLQKKERYAFANQKIKITKKVFSEEFAGLKLDQNRLGLNIKNQKFTLNTTISLFDFYDYEKYKNNWHASFQTKDKWPLEFSHDLVYKQRIDIGDIRTNWELNRHYQFVLLAKNYYVTNESQYLNELLNLFDDWNQENPFLFGVSWTSIMEIAIRCNSWIFLYCFLKNSQDVPEGLLEELRVGIINMTSYVANHYSRFSSANNHVIVEAYVLGLSGIVFNYKPWINTAIDILDTEIVRQNYSDGVNKELSLHYQAFVMEAVGLLIRTMNVNGITVPEKWINILEKMSQYVSSCFGKFGDVVVFGDNDEGKILDLQGETHDYYKYVMELMSLLLKQRYVDLSDVNENIRWIFSDKQIMEARNKMIYDNSKSISYKEGGNSILKSPDGRILIGIDHAALGFGMIAAHGHSDALSYQMFVNGSPVIVDPGTYNYHFRPDDRDYFRKTIIHNTVTINEKDQSEMIGPFLWGRKARTVLDEAVLSENSDVVIAHHDGYAPIIHKRKFSFNRKDRLIIEDWIEGVHNNTRISSTLLFGPGFNALRKDENQVEIEGKNLRLRVLIYSEKRFNIEINDAIYSSMYLSKEIVKEIRITQSTNQDSMIRMAILLEL